VDRGHKLIPVLDIASRISDAHFTRLGLLPASAGSQQTKFRRDTVARAGLLARNHFDEFRPLRNWEQMAFEPQSTNCPPYAKAG
jgi:hypothetical protein